MARESKDNSDRRLKTKKKWLPLMPTLPSLPDNRAQNKKSMKTSKTLKTKKTLRFAQSQSVASVSSSAISQSLLMDIQQIFWWRKTNNQDITPVHWTIRKCESVCVRLSRYVETNKGTSAHVCVPVCLCVCVLACHFMFDSYAMVRSVVLWNLQLLWCAVLWQHWGVWWQH